MPLYEVGHGTTRASDSGLATVRMFDVTQVLQALQQTAAMGAFSLYLPAA
jgi:hypothetical protein